MIITRNTFPAIVILSVYLTLLPAISKGGILREDQLRIGVLALDLDPDTYFDKKAVADRLYQFLKRYYKIPEKKEIRFQLLHLEPATYKVLSGAMASYKAGLDNYTQLKYREAIQLFNEAQKLLEGYLSIEAIPSFLPRILLYKALCYNALSDPRGEAVLRQLALCKLQGLQIPPFIKDRLAKVTGLDTPQLLIKIEPVKAVKILVDYATQYLSPTTLKLLKGQHTLIVEKTGYLRKIIRVEVDKEGLEIPLSLEKSDKLLSPVELLIGRLAGSLQQSPKDLPEKLKQLSSLLKLDGLIVVSIQKAATALKLAPNRVYLTLYNQPNGLSRTKISLNLNFTVKDLPEKSLVAYFSGDKKDLVVPKSEKKKKSGDKFYKKWYFWVGIGAIVLATGLFFILSETGQSSAPSGLTIRIHSE